MGAGGCGQGQVMGWGMMGFGDWGYELVLGMRLCAQCWSRGEQRSRCIVWWGRHGNTQTSSQCSMTQKAAYTEYQCCMEGSDGLAGRQEALPTS